MAARTNASSLKSPITLQAGLGSDLINVGVSAISSLLARNGCFNVSITSIWQSRPKYAEQIILRLERARDELASPGTMYSLNTNLFFFEGRLWESVCVLFITFVLQHRNRSQ